MNAVEIEDLKELVRKAEHGLSNCENVEKGLEALREVTGSLFSKERGCTETGHIYAQFAEFLLNQLHSKWYLVLTDVQKSELFDAYYLKGFPEQAFMVLMNVITVTSPSDKLDKALHLIENFLRSSAIHDMFLVQCVPLEDDNTLKREIRSEVWDELVSYLVSLPERIANKLGSQVVQDIFRSPIFFGKIGDDIVWCLDQLRSRIDLSIDCSLQFLSRILARSCLSGHSEAVMSSLLKFLSLKTSDDYVWRRMSQKLFAGIPDNCIESVMTYLFRKSSWYKTISKLIGSAVIDNPNLHYLLTHKLLLVRSFEEMLVLQNILGYLSDGEQRRAVFVKVFLNLLDVWGNKSNLKHRPYKQHVYITSAILISLSYLNNEEKSQNKEVVMPKLMHGMDSHLSSPIPDIRKLGMFAAKCIVKVINPNGPQLEFEYERDREIEELEKLLIPPSDASIDRLSESTKSIIISNDVTENIPCDLKNSDGIIAVQSVASEELDSDDDDDDDLEPYDISNDTSVKKHGRPRYLRDCIDGLLEQNDGDLMEVSLEGAEQLIRSDPIGRDEVAIEMAKILLHLDDRFCIKNFVMLRFGALVAITAACPKLVAEYLGKQFYDRNYNVRQRMDILEVLVAAAQELSKPEWKATTKSVTSSASLIASPLPMTENWRDVVQKRIDSKTKRFSKGRVQPSSLLVPNRFAPTCGHFFFPLIRSSGHHENTFDILGSDFLLLGRLIYALGMIMYAALNAPIAFQMGQELLEFLWVVRFHTEPYVRKALIFALCMVVLSVPAHHFVNYLQETIMNYEDWLKVVVCKDLDDDCIQLAGQALSLIRDTMKKEVPASMCIGALQATNAISSHPLMFK